MLNLLAILSVPFIAAAQSATPAIPAGSEFNVLVKTGDQWGAGTSAEVFIQFGDGAGHQVNSFLGDDFDRKSVKNFKLTSAVGIPQVCSLVLGQNRHGLFSNWFVEYVTIQNGVQSWSFPINRWLEKDPDTGRAMININRCKASDPLANVGGPAARSTVSSFGGSMGSKSSDSDSTFSDTTEDASTSNADDFTDAPSSTGVAPSDSTDDDSTIPPKSSGNEFLDFMATQNSKRSESEVLDSESLTAELDTLPSTTIAFAATPAMSAPAPDASYSAAAIADANKMVPYARAATVGYGSVLPPIVPPPQPIVGPDAAPVTSVPAGYGAPAPPLSDSYMPPAASVTALPIVTPPSTYGAPVPPPSTYTPPAASVVEPVTPPPSTYGAPPPSTYMPPAASDVEPVVPPVTPPPTGYGAPAPPLPEAYVPPAAPVSEPVLTPVTPPPSTYGPPAPSAPESYVPPAAPVAEPVTPPPSTYDAPAPPAPESYVPPVAEPVVTPVTPPPSTYDAPAPPAPVLDVPAASYDDVPPATPPPSAYGTPDSSSSTSIAAPDMSPNVPAPILPPRKKCSHHVYASAPSDPSGFVPPYAK